MAERYIGAEQRVGWNQSRMIKDKGIDTALAHIDFLELYKYLTTGKTTLGDLEGYDRESAQHILDRWGVDQISFRVGVVTERFGEVPVRIETFTFGIEGSRGKREFDLSDVTSVFVETTGDELVRQSDAL